MDLESRFAGSAGSSGSGSACLDLLYDLIS